MRRRFDRPSSVTSLIDVLFILVFAALAQRAVSASPGETPIEPLATPASDAAPIEITDSAVETGQSFASLRRAGLAQAAASLSRGEVIVVRVSAAGEVTAIESAGTIHDVAVPLLEKVSDPDIALTYLGDRSPALQLCAIAGRMFDVDGRLVVVAIEGRLDDLRVALVAGLTRDQSRCRQHGGMAVVVATEDAGQ